MPYQETFWAALAAAAPIIALANQITLTESIAARQFFARVPADSNVSTTALRVIKSGRSLTTIALSLGSINLLVQVVVFYEALSSLIHARNDADTGWFGVLAVYGLATVAVSAVTSGFIRSNREQLEPKT